MGVLSVCESKMHCGSFEGGEGGRRAYVFTPGIGSQCFFALWGFVSRWLVPTSHLIMGRRARGAEHPKTVNPHPQDGVGLPLLFPVLVSNGLTVPQLEEEKWAWAGSAWALIAACPAPAPAPACSLLSASCTLPAPASLGVIGTPPAPAD